MKLPKLQGIISRSGLKDKIILHIGNAIDIIPKLKKQFDLIFIDGEKREYPEYYKICSNY